MTIIINSIQELQLIGSSINYPFDGNYELGGDIDATGFDYIPKSGRFVRQSMGNWNASTNTPYLEDGVGTVGMEYKITVAGEWNGIYWTLNRFAGYNGYKWELRQSSSSIFIVKFTGTFDGNGHAITGLTINQPSKSAVGLFGEMDGGYVGNTNFYDVNITGLREVGAIIGNCEETCVYNCNVTGNITSLGYYVGGLVGYMGSWDNLPYEAIRDCTFNGNITAVGDIGGMVGSIYNGSIYNCHTSGILTSPYTDGGYNGGVVGFFDICTANMYHIENCSSTCDIISSGYSSGGLIGYASLNSRILNSSASGNVSGGMYVGGLIGYLYGELIDGCSASGNVTATRDHVDGMFEGDYVGGLLGGCGNSFSTTEIKRSYSTGDVTATGDYVGGLIGESDYISNINDCYATGHVTGRNYVGGLIGEVWGDGPTIRNCYSVGNPSGLNYVNGSIGGYIDLSIPITVSNVYWDTETSDINTSVYGEGKTTEEMKQQDTFVNWDFDSIWKIIENVTYPVFELVIVNVEVDSYISDITIETKDVNVITEHNLPELGSTVEVDNLNIFIDSRIVDIVAETHMPDFGSTLFEFDLNSDTPNGYITKCPSMYDNERRLFDNMITESINQHGVCLTYYITTYDTNYDRIWGEDNDRRFVRVFDFMAYYTLPREDKLWSKFGIEGMDSFSMFVSKIHFQDTSTMGHDMVAGNIGFGTYDSYVPKVGDIIMANYNKYIYEITEVKEETSMFLLSKQHVWEFVVKTYKNEQLSMTPSTSASMQYMDFTNKLKDVFNIDEVIEEKKEKVIYKPKVNEKKVNDPFAGW